MNKNVGFWIALGVSHPCKDEWGIFPVVVFAITPHEVQRRSGDPFPSCFEYKRIQISQLSEYE